MSAAAEGSKVEAPPRDASAGSIEHQQIERRELALSLSGQESKAMQSVVELSRLEVARRSTANRSSFFQTLRRIVRLDFLSFEDEIGRAIDRAFAEFAREMRK